MTAGPPAALGPFALLVLAAVIWSHRDTLWNPELSALSPVSAADQALDRTLRADLGAPDVRYLVVVSDTDQESVLRAAERVGERLERLVDAAPSAGSTPRSACFRASRARRPDSRHCRPRRARGPAAGGDARPAASPGASAPFCRRRGGGQERPPAQPRRSRRNFLRGRGRRAARAA